jgi:hypothetical protein
MPSKPGEEPAGKELIASRTFCSLTIKEKSPVLKASGKKSSRDGEGCFFFNSSATSSLNEANESKLTILCAISHKLQKSKSSAKSFIVTNCIRYYDLS